MSETAVDAVVTEALAIEAPTAEASAPLRREDVRERILSHEWKDEQALLADRESSPAESVRATTGSEGAEDGAEFGDAQGRDDATPAPDADSPPSDEPPAEAVIGEGGNRIVVRTADGKYAPAPDVKLEFQVGEKVYLKSPAELVRMARDGVAGQQFRTEVQQYREQVPQVLQQMESIKSELEAQRALNLEILNDETAYLKRREEWDLLNSPQERLRRMEAQQQMEAQQRYAAQEAAQRQQVVLQYYQQEILPVQEDILTNYPQVSQEAKLGRISIDTAPLMQNGVIPPHRLPEYKAYLNGPFREWLYAEAAKVDQAIASRNAQLKQTIRRGQVQAQQVVQSVGKQLAPNGRAAPDAPPAPRKPRNREEAKAMIIGRAWQE